MDTKQTTKMRVLMQPWLAHGHISPYLELAKKLANRNFTIYFCSTPVNLTSIRKRITQDQSLFIKLVELHLPSSPDLPPHHHTTNALPPHLMPALKSAFDNSVPQFSAILKTLNPDLVIYDYNQPWVPTIAAELDIPAVEFLTPGAAMCSLSLHRYNKPGVEFPFPEIQLKVFFQTRFRRAVEETFREGNTIQGPLTAMENSFKIILFNTCRELEGKYVDYLSILTGKKIVPVGPLVQEVVNETEETEVMNWLGKKNDSSTVFVSFGSEFFLSREEIQEVAHGLEISGVNFIWVVRFPVGETTRVEEALPKGFLDRVGERGLIVEGWAPQAQILAHSSTGGFVSHCGWNSVLESLNFGVPIIAMPMQLDQPPNARLVEELGMAMEVEREEDGRLNSHEIAKVIRKVVVEESGEGMRVKAKEFSNNVRLRGEEAIDELVEELVRLCKEKNLVKIKSSQLY
ncbi:UDP-glucosyltransferase 29-like [Rhododendron vialii]|uniref:UDP-glucosyltransferase 29-like n=1 Tax=Rhododendron vialii TaxID=182163 RepID=UPI00265F104B|nr:UDP-glucosyltransferase 29-like [Rhododendron vialii]